MLKICNLGLENFSWAHTAGATPSGVPLQTCDVISGMVGRPPTTTRNTPDRKCSKFATWDLKIFGRHTLLGPPGRGLRSEHVTPLVEWPAPACKHFPCPLEDDDHPRRTRCVPFFRVLGGRRPSLADEALEGWHALICHISCTLQLKQHVAAGPVTLQGCMGKTVPQTLHTV